MLGQLPPFVLNEEKFKHYPVKVLLEATVLVVCHTRIGFGAILAHQSSGIAIDMAVAPQSWPSMIPQTSCTTLTPTYIYFMD